jgi:hypothetical protein
MSIPNNNLIRSTLCSELHRWCCPLHSMSTNTLWSGRSASADPPAEPDDGAPPPWMARRLLSNRDEHYLELL